MIIKRDKYLHKLANQIDKPMIKIITGVRRCGKSYLLFRLFYDYLLQNGFKEEQIICVNLEDRAFSDLREPDALYNYVMKKASKKNRKYFVFIDEAQFSIKKEDLKNKGKPLPIYDVLNGFLSRNLDVYITGSNS